MPKKNEQTIKISEAIKKCLDLLKQQEEISELYGEIKQINDELDWLNDSFVGTSTFKWTAQEINSRITVLNERYSYKMAQLNKLLKGRGK